MTSSAPTTGATAEQPPRRSAWFCNAPFDLLLIVGTPLLVWPLVKAAEGIWSAELLGKLILLTATGHYFATFVRTYGDRRLYRRFQTRFTVVPAVLLITCIAAFLTNGSGPLLLVTGAWAFWHWLAQAFGFARIYDAKIGSFRPLTAFLDKALVVTWFVGAIVLNQSATANFCELFLDAGVTLPGAAVFATLRSVVLIVVIAVTAAYLANLIATMVRREPVSAIKQLSHVSTIGFYWFAFGAMPNFFVAYVLYELFHDIQYFGITWLSCRARVKSDGTAGWMRGMFASGPARIFLFLGVMLAFGALDLGGRERFGEDKIGQLLKGVFLTAALLHYYYDGFIWRVRESDLRHDLGMSGRRAGQVRGSVRHAATWGFFFVPLFLLWQAGPGPVTPLERTRMMVEAAPASFEAQANYAHALVVSGDFDAGLPHYARSIELYPDLAQSQFNYAAALDFHGSVDPAMEHYRRALQCRDAEGIHAQAHLNLGVCLYLSRQEEAAQQHLDAARRLGGATPLQRLTSLGNAIDQAGRGERALLMFTAATRLEPRDPDLKLRLASLLVKSGKADAAAARYLEVLMQQPEHATALVGLGAVRLAQGRCGEARSLVEQALRSEPANASALQLLHAARSAGGAERAPR